MAYYTVNQSIDQSNMRSNSAPTQNLSSVGQGYQWTQLPHQQFHQPQQSATPFFGQQNYSQPSLLYRPQQSATPFFGQQYPQPFPLYQPQQLATPLSGQQNNSQLSLLYRPQQSATPFFGQQYPQPFPFYQPQQLATPSYSQQNPQQWQHRQQPAINTEPEERTSSATSGLTVRPERPKWYYEAVQKNGAAYADKLWEDVMQGFEEKVRKKMQEMKIAERRRAAESTPSVKTEPSDDESEASVARDLRLGLIEDITRSSGHMPNLPKYKMHSLPRGMCIIFNAENFTKKKLKKRIGTQMDVEALLNTFKNHLKFETQVELDPTAEEYLDCLRKISRMDHSRFDCFVCIILSHGCKGRVYGKNGQLMAIDALTGLFRGEYVRSLMNKPKLFFIQACQGNHPQKAVKFHQDAPATLPNESDTLVSLSTVPGYASNRNYTNGTLFITSLCDIINNNYKKVDLLSMLTMVNELMSDRALKGKGKQIGNPSHTLRKQIFFNQGLDE